MSLGAHEHVSSTRSSEPALKVSHRQSGVTRLVRLSALHHPASSSALSSSLASSAPAESHSWREAALTLATVFERELQVPPSGGASVSGGGGAAQHEAHEVLALTYHDEDGDEITVVRTSLFAFLLLSPDEWAASCDVQSSDAELWDMLDSCSGSPLRVSLISRCDSMGSAFSTTAYATSVNTGSGDARPPASWDADLLHDQHQQQDIYSLASSFSDWRYLSSSVAAPNAAQSATPTVLGADDDDYDEEEGMLADDPESPQLNSDSTNIIDQHGDPPTPVPETMSLPSPEVPDRASTSSAFTRLDQSLSRIQNIVQRVMGDRDTPAATSSNRDGSNSRSSNSSSVVNVIEDTRLLVDKLRLGVNGIREEALKISNEWQSATSPPLPPSSAAAAALSADPVAHMNESADIVNSVQLLETSDTAMADVSEPSAQLLDARMELDRAEEQIRHATSAVAQREQQRKDKGKDRAVPREKEGEQQRETLFEATSTIDEEAQEDDDWSVMVDHLENSDDSGKVLVVLKKGHGQFALPTKLVRYRAPQMVRLWSRLESACAETCAERWLILSAQLIDFYEEQLRVANERNMSVAMADAEEEQQRHVVNEGGYDPVEQVVLDNVAMQASLARRLEKHDLLAPEDNRDEGRSDEMEHDGAEAEAAQESTTEQRHDRDDGAEDEMAERAVLECVAHESVISNILSKRNIGSSSSASSSSALQPPSQNGGEPMQCSPVKGSKQHSSDEKQAHVSPPSHVHYPPPHGHPPPPGHPPPYGPPPSHAARHSHAHAHAHAHHHGPPQHHPAGHHGHHGHQRQPHVHGLPHVQGHRHAHHQLHQQSPPMFTPGSGWVAPPPPPPPFPPMLPFAPWTTWTGPAASSQPTTPIQPTSSRGRGRGVSQATTMLATEKESVKAKLSEMGVDVTSSRVRLCLSMALAKATREPWPQTQAQRDARINSIVNEVFARLAQPSASYSIWS